MQSDALNVFDYLNSISFPAVLEPIVLYCVMLLKCFKDASIMFMIKNLNVDAHHMIYIGKSLDFRTWLDCILPVGVISPYLVFFIE